MYLYVNERKIDEKYTVNFCATKNTKLTFTRQINLMKQSMLFLLFWNESAGKVNENYLSYD